MSGHGFPDDEFAGIPHGALSQSGTSVSCPTGGTELLSADLPLAAYSALRLVCNVSTNPATVVATWQLDGAPSGVTDTSTGTLTTGKNSVLLQAKGHTLTSLVVAGSGGTASIDYALAGANQLPFSGAFTSGLPYAYYT